MADWNFLSNHGRVLFCVAQDPEVRLRDLAHQLALTERTAYGIVTDLANAGVVTKERDGRRNRYHVHADQTFDAALSRQVTVGEMLVLFNEPGSTAPQPEEGKS